MPETLQAAAVSHKPNRIEIAPIVLATAIALYNLLLNPLHGNPKETWYVTLAIGVLFGQPLLAATWAALGPGSFVVRLPATAATLVVWIFAFSIAELNLFARDSATNEMNVEMAVAFLAVFVLAAAILGIMRRITGFHLSLSPQAAERNQSGRHQFGMKYLLGWMTACALLIVVGRSFADDAANLGQGWSMLLQEVVGPIVFLLLLTMPPAIMPLLALSRPTPWRWILLVALAWPVSLWAAVEVINMASRGGQKPNEYWILGGVQVGAMLTALACAAVLRLAGLHLTNASDSAAKTSTGTGAG